MNPLDGRQLDRLREEFLITVEAYPAETWSAALLAAVTAVIAGWHTDAHVPPQLLPGQRPSLEIVT